MVAEKNTDADKQYHEISVVVGLGKSFGIDIHRLDLIWNITGVMTDLLVYTIVIPVLPFQLERLGYNNVSGLVGWLLFGYVCRSCYRS